MTIYFLSKKGKRLGVECGSADEARATFARLADAETAVDASTGAVVARRYHRPKAARVEQLALGDDGGGK